MGWGEEYSKPREYTPPDVTVVQCTSTTIEANKSLVVEDRNPHPHAGTIAHRCELKQKHEEQCECLCGYRWWKFKHII